MTPSQLYEEEKQNGKLKAEIKESLGSKALSRYEAEELIQLNVLNEIERARKINPLEIKRLKENHNMTADEKLDIISHLYKLNGYEVENRDSLEIQLKRKKKFSYLSAFLWFLLLGVGLVIYILYYLLRGDDHVTVQVADNYKVKPESIDNQHIDENTEEDSEQESQETSEDLDEEKEILEEPEEQDELKQEEESTEITDDTEESLESFEKKE